MIADGTLSEIQDYVDQVLTGEIAVSKAVRGSIERSVRDLDRQSTPDFPYHFDAAWAAKCIRFYPSVLRHSIGRYSKMPFELSPWQKFCTAQIFGWKRDCDNTRRFRKAYRTMARKNGKSSWAAAEAIFMAAFDINPNTGKPESVAQVLLSATKRDQAAKVVLAECVRMRAGSVKVSAKSRFVNKELRFDANDGEIVAIGSDKPYDGLNPHCVIIDELHAMREHHRGFHDTMITGSGSRDQPLVCYITTAGDDRSHLWKEVYDYAKAVSIGALEDNEYFAFIAELDEEDDPFDESAWIKANPNLGISVSTDYLRQQAREHKTTSIGTNRFTRYHGNRLVSSTEKAFDLERWDDCKGDLSDWVKADAIGCGIDLGGRDDLAACAFVARFPLIQKGDKTVYRYEAQTYAFISEDTERDLNKAPFVDFIYQDYLNKCRYPISELQAKVMEKCDEYGAWGIAYDPAGALSMSEVLTAGGYNAVRMGQNCSMFNEPIREFIKAMRDKRIAHDGNPLLRWCMNNAVLIRDRQDRWMFDKRDSADKIDPVVAMVMAFRMASLAPERVQGSLYL
jgi:phage terminase large subunit-like protein